MGDDRRVVNIRASVWVDRIERRFDQPPFTNAN